MIVQSRPSIVGPDHDVRARAVLLWLVYGENRDARENLDYQVSIDLMV